MDVDNAADTVSPADVTAAENSTDANGDKGDIMSDKILKNVSGQDGAGDENSKDTVISNDSEESAVQPTSSENLFDQLKSVDDNAKAVVSDKPVGEIDAADESDNYEDDAAVDCAEDSASNDKCEDVGKVKAIVDTGANDETMEVDESVNDDNGDVDDTTEENKTSDMDSSKNDTMEVDKSFDNSLVAPEVVEYNEDNTEVEKQQTETNDIMCMENIVDVDTSVLNNTDDASGVNVNNGANEETTLDENQEVDDEEQPDEAVGEEGADEEVSLLPDTERNPTDAEKERVFASDASTNQAASSTDATTSELVESESNENESQTNDDPSNLIEICELQDATVTNVKCVECEKNLPSRFHIDGEDVAEQRNMCSEICAQNFMEKHSNKYIVRFNVIKIALILDHVETCKICEAKKICRFRFKYSSCDSEYVYLCGDACAVTFVASQAKNRFEIDRSLYFIEDVNAAKVPNLKKRCLQCLEEKECSYYCTKSPTDKDYENDYNDFSFLFICADDCLNLLLKEQPDRLEVKNKTISENNVEIGEVAAEPRPVFSRSDVQTRTAQLQRKNSFIRKCIHCRKKVDNVGKNSNDKLYWETMTFCNDICMNIYQAANGKCTVCLEAVKLPNLGKYCVRFGFEMRQFCCLGCLTEFKNGLKLCSYCQKDISTSKDCFLAQLNIDKGGFKDFCTQDCMKKYVELSKTVAKKKRIPGPMADCAVCNNNKLMRVEFFLEGQEYYFCSNPCFSAFKFVNTVFPDPCGTCLKFFERKTTSHYELYIESECIVFCTQLCQLMFVVFNRKIAPCTWCRVKKYNFDMVQKKINNKLMLFCSTNCIRMYHVSLSQMHKKKQPCDQCKSVRCPEYHMTMSDGTTRSFCTYNCVLVFQAQFADAPLLLEGENNRTVVPTGAAKRFDQKQQVNKQALTPAPAPARKVMPKKQAGPIISQVTSLAPTLALVDPTLDKGTRSTRAAKRTFPTPNYKRSLPAFNNDDSHDYEDYSSPAIEPPPSPPPPPPKAPTPPPREIIKTRTEIVTQIVTVPPLPKQVRNVSVGVQPLQKTKGVTAAPETKSVECQTDDFLEKRYFVPIPVPMYMPMPMHMYSLPCPIPVPIPLPIPVPVFIPTTRNSANGIMKEIKKIQDKMPADPFEAELLMMAEMVAGEPKKCESDSSDEEEQTYEVEHHHHHQQQHVAPIHTQHQHQSANNSYVGEDVLQMALNQMADEYGQPIATNSVDLETAMQANTITPNTSGMEDHHGEHMYLIASPTISGRGRKRGGRSIKNEPKRERRDDHQISLAIQHHHQQMEEVEAVPMSTEKPDANMCLKFTFGVNAWKQWVMTKNSDIEKSSIRVKPFKNDLLSLTGDELNFSLCLFVQEVRKPNGSEYAPDTIYYLVLGIQQYLYENGRVDNIFTDTFYDKFTECLDDVAKRFSVLYNDSQYIVTRVEEEHLWECKQLGAHSPHVLLSTLMFFNTKHFNLTSVDEHMQLSFSHIMKHWKRNPNQPGSGKLGNTRNVLLRFYPPQSAIEGNSRKKKVYEQQENEENPLRCPVKLYEFYLSKCPESVKPRNDVFYLQPERSCVPDSPVWYSTQALGRDQLSKMLHRVKMVKEINIALLSS